MSTRTWKRIAEYGKTTGAWLAGTKCGAVEDEFSGHRMTKWDFTKPHSRKFGRGFYAALNRMPETEYKKIIISLVKKKEKDRGRSGSVLKGLTEKQWKYLGLLMTKADPACRLNPRVDLPKKPEFKSEAPKVILRKKKDLTACAQSTNTVVPNS